MKVVNDENIEKTHSNIWENLWSTGFSISTSKASDVLNGDLINATMYYVLSSVRALSYETPSSTSLAIASSSLSDFEGCYGANHDTLYVSFTFYNKINVTNMFVVIILDKL